MNVQVANHFATQVELAASGARTGDGACPKDQIPVCEFTLKAKEAHCAKHKVTAFGYDNPCLDDPLCEYELGPAQKTDNGRGVITGLHNVKGCVAKK